MERRTKEKWICALMTVMRKMKMRNCTSLARDRRAPAKQVECGME
jgi:hypothetical protein